MFLGGGAALAGEYLNSAHGTQNGDITGVERLSAYGNGNCAHCHEQHASIDGSEPDPAGGPDDHLLFYPSHISQADNFCFECHVDVGSRQTGGGINNYSYTYRAGDGDDTGITGDDIKEFFNNTSSSHGLDNLVTFITGKWGYTARSNPCCACHNPHAAQGDPAGSSSDKSPSTRGYPVSRPSLHSDPADWGLWGDAAGEKMSDYTGNYQAPYRWSSTTTYEPDGSTTTTDGSNLTDYVTFCQDCHTYDMTGAPYSLSHTPIDWSTLGGESGGDKHGKNVATQDGTDGYVNLLEPYSSAWSSTNGLVLACTDCHEPHGGFSVSLIRKGVNGDAVSAATWADLCAKCHYLETSPDYYGDELHDIHHGTDPTTAPYPGPPSGCGNCHPSGGGGTDPISCINCHFHGGDDSWVTDQGKTASGRRTF